MNGNFTKVFLPIVQQVMPSVIAQSLLSVQPMTAPAGNIFSLQSKGRAIRSKYYQSYSFMEPFDQKIGKGRKGKPHWRETRVLYHEKRYDSMWSILMKKYHDYVAECYSVSFSSGADSIWEWIKPLAAQHNARVIYDMVYNCKGLHFETMEDLVTFKLTLE